VNSGWPILVAGGCLGLATFFSVGHSALRSASWRRLEEAFAAGGHAERAAALRRRREHLFAGTATLRLLFSLAVLLALVYVFYQPGVSSHRRLLWPLLEAFLLGVLLLSIFSVAMAHTWAKHAGTSFLVRFYTLLDASAWAVYPLTEVLRLFEPPIARLADLGRKDEDDEDGRQEDFLSIVEEGRKEGVLDEEDQEMITSVLEFRDTTAGEIMTPRTEVAGMAAGASLTEAVQTIIKHGHSRYPAYEESIDNVVGILYAKDLLKDLQHAGEAGGIRRHLRQPYFVPEAKTLRDLLQEFRKQKVQIAIVLDEYGGTAGLVTMEDILEEIVGEIVDEHEAPQEETLKKIDEQTFEADARCNVEELNAALGLNLPEDDAYETVGGFVFSRLGRLPRTGETFDYEQWHFTILEAGDRKVNRVRMARTAAAGPAEQE